MINIFFLLTSKIIIKKLSSKLFRVWENLINFFILYGKRKKLLSISRPKTWEHHKNEPISLLVRIYDYNEKEKIRRINKKEHDDL